MHTFVSYTIGMVRKVYILHPRGAIIGYTIVSDIDVSISMCAKEHGGLNPLQGVILIMLVE